MPDLIPNVLAERYATPAMKVIWSSEGKVILERELWIAVMKGQAALGLDVPADAISAYESVKSEVNLESIMDRERVTRHDVKARIEEFNALAGEEHVHKGMTSRDLTENVEQLQIFRGLELVRDKAVAVLAAFSRRAEEFADLPLTARTHNVAAQLTTLGKRLAMFGEQTLGAFFRLEEVIASYSARGLKGAVGTQLDQLNLFDGDSAKASDLETRVLGHLGLPAACSSVGQVYPRSLDLRVVGALTELASGPSSFAKTLRIMAGHELAGEGFAKGQVGSSAMPHKMNSRSCERINGFHLILQGYLTMAGGLSGDQWNEGDVSCSVVRRVMLPDTFFAIDGLLETTLTVLNQIEVFQPVIQKELEHYLPFLLTTTVLMEAVKSGAGRESAHEAIKEHAVTVVRELRSGSLTENDLWNRLAGDSRLGLEADDLAAIRTSASQNIGAAKVQVEGFADSVSKIVLKHPEAARYKPGSIL
ncbi:MAG: adenylosuccinate lyase [Verrucomicrobiota bacterium]